MTDVDAAAEAPWRRAVTAAVPVVLAVAAWAALAVGALLLRPRLGPQALDAGPQTLSLAVGVTLAVLLAAWAVWRPVGDRYAALALGLVAGWASFFVIVTLAGTPYGISGLSADCGRTTAMAERYTTTWASADPMIAGLPSQYPPLYFWLWGRASAGLGVQAWEVMGVWQGLALGGGVLATGLLWRTTTTWLRAAAAAAVGLGLLYGSASWDPCKNHEGLSMLLAVPVFMLAHLAVASVARDGRLRLGRAAAWGALVSICFLTYQLWVTYSLPVLLVVWVVVAVRARRVGRVLLHLLVAGAVAALVASWYVVPLALALRADPAARVDDPLMVLTSLITPPGLPAMSGVTFVAGLLGLVVVALRLPSTRAALFAALAGAAVLVEAAGLWNVVRGGESLFSYKAAPWLLVVLGAAVVVLPPSRWWQWSSWRPPFDGRDPLPEEVTADVRAGSPRDGDRDSGARLSQAQRRRVAAVVALALVLASVTQLWSIRRAPVVGVDTLASVYTKTHARDRTALAYLTALPNCGRVKGLPDTIDTVPCYPAEAVDRCLTDTLGTAALPVLVAWSNQASVFRPNHLLLGLDATGGGPLEEWQQRYDWLATLPGITDPAAFARAARSGPFGPVDGFVLEDDGKGGGLVTYRHFRTAYPLTFRLAQFDPAAYAVCRVPGGFVAVDRTASRTPR